MHECQPSAELRDLRRSAFSEVLFRAYRWCRVRRACTRVALRLEGNQLYFATLRRVLAAYHGAVAGAYSYGSGLVPGACPAGVVIGRYVSIAAVVRVFLRNHPLGRLSLHPFFCNAALGQVPEDNISTGTQVVEADAWLGERAMIMPAVPG